MREYLKNYKINLTALSPIHIGGGLAISKKEYYLDKRAKKYYMFDQVRLITLLRKKALIKKYEEFLMNGNDNLGSWLFNNNIDSKLYMDCLMYELDASYIDLDNKDKQKNVVNKDIISFIKDAYNNPYIPGSSLKGAIRTALLSADILDNASKYSKCKNDINYEIEGRRTRGKSALSSPTKSIEVNCFNRLKRKEMNSDILNDVMTGIRISDSKPLSVKDLIICQKIDVATDGHSNKLNVLRECIKPNTEIEFTLTIDTTLCDYTVDDIMKAIQTINNHNRMIYESKFPVKIPNEKYMIRIGGGAGYNTKSIMYSLFSQREATANISEIMEANFPRHKHRKDVENGVSPHMSKCTEYKNELIRIGYAKITID